MMLLHCVIRQMDELVIQILHVELLRSRTDIPVLEPVPFLIPVYARQTHIATDIELSLLIQEWHDVLLHNVGSLPAQRI